MKSILLCGTVAAAMLLSVCAGNLYATDEALSQGSRIVAGTVTFDSKGGDLYEDDAGDREYEWRLFPSGGYFLRDRVAASVILEVASVKQGRKLDQIWALGPGARYYVDLSEDKPGGTYLFFSCAVLFGQIIHDTGEVDTQRAHYALTTLKLDTGFTYMLSEAVGATIAAFYDLSWAKQKEPEEGSSLNGNNFGFEFGFTSFLF